MKTLRLLFALALMASAQDALTNDAILKMVKCQINPEDGA